jgi:hypothetical protein
MAVTYHCDNCDMTADTLAGWIFVSVLFLHDDPNVPSPPGGRMLDYTAPDLLFHAATCRDAWCAKAGLTAPV